MNQERALREQRRRRETLRVGSQLTRENVPYAYSLNDLNSACPMGEKKGEWRAVAERKGHLWVFWGSLSRGDFWDFGGEPSSVGHRRQYVIPGMSLVTGSSPAEEGGSVFTLYARLFRE